MRTPPKAKSRVKAVSYETQEELLFAYGSLLLLLLIASADVLVRGL